MTNAIIEKSFLEGQIIPTGFEEIAFRTMIFLALKNGGIVGNSPDTKKINEIIDGLNEFGADILFQEGNADIFPIRKEKEKVDLKGSLIASRFLIPLGFFLSKNITFENINLPIFARKALFDYAKRVNVRIFGIKNSLKIDSSKSELNRLEFENIEGSFWAGSFILAAASTSTEFFADLDEYVASQPSIYHTAATFDLLDYDYNFEENQKVFYLSLKNWDKEIELDIPPSTKLASYYSAAFLLAGKGKVKCSKLFYKEIELLRSIAKENINEREDGFEIKEPLQQIDFPSQIAPQSFPYFLPILFVLCSRAKKTTKIGPFVPYRKKRLQELKDYAKRLNEIGAKIDYIEPYFEIKPSNFYGGISEINDAYEGMAMTIAGLISKSTVKLKNIEKIIGLNKNFFDDLKTCGAKIEL
ncbi:MAG: hypothetical protein ACK4J0_03275 [Candidatus Anstonellaceae archaeon]